VRRPCGLGFEADWERDSDLPDVVDGAGESAGAGAAELFVEGFEFSDEIEDVGAGVGAAGGVAEVGAATEGAMRVNGAAHVFAEERAGPVRGLGDGFTAGGAPACGGGDGFPLGEVRGFAGEFEAATLGAAEAGPGKGA
jgi:hypothetical protein